MTARHAWPRRTAIVPALLALAFAGAACAPKPVEALPAQSAAFEPPAPPPRVVSGEARVLSIDESRSLLFLQQAPLREMNWPAVNIAYVASGPAMDGVEAGDHIAFELELGGGGYLLSTRQLNP